MNTYKKRLKEMYPEGWRWVSVARRIPGWLTDAEANGLFEIARSREPFGDLVIVELGSWHGRSSVLLAAGLRGKANARLYCIDPFGQDENPELQAREYDPLLRRMPYSLEEGFRRTVRRCGVAHIVEAVKGYSYDVVRTWDRAIDVLFIDASHEYDAVHRDFRLWSPFVKLGGIVALHDVSPVWPGPSRVMAEDLQPPDYAEVQQVDSLVWAVKKQMEDASAPRSSRTVVTIPKVDFDARLWELGRLFRENAQGVKGSMQDIARLCDALAARDEERGRLIAEAERAAGQIGVLESELRRVSAELLGQCETGGRLGAELAARTEAGERLETELAAKERDRARLIAETERAAGQIGVLESELHRVSADLLDQCETGGRLGAELDQRTAEVQRLSADMAAITASHRDRLQTCVAQIEELNRAVSDKDNRVSSLKRETADASSRLQVREYELSRTVAELEASRHAVRALRRSWSWRLSAPLRAVLDMLLAARRLLRGTGRGMSLRSKALRYLQWLWYSRQVRASGLFDESYYLGHNPDVAQSKSDPLRHFFFFGGAELRNPHPLFDLHYYCGRNPDVAKSSVNPLVHYLKWGASEGRDPHPDFDTSFYLDRYPDVREAGVNPLVHFMGPGVPQGLDPNPWFDTSEYLDCNPNVALKGVNPLVHHLEHREAEWRRQRMESSENAPQVLPAASGGSLGLPLGMRIDPRTTELRAGLRAEYERSERPPLDSEYDAVPLVSVVIPCYNYGYYLEDAILSAMMACSYPMEILVVDDGSTDEGSLAAVEDLAGRYHFRLLRQKNTGQTGARNNGVRNSHGKFIQFLDADDLLAPGKIDFQVDMMTYGRGIDIAVCEYELCDADGEGRRSMAPSTLAGFAFNAEDFLLRWERGFSLPIHCALFRREVLDPEQFQCITKAGKEDWIFWIVVASKSPRFHFHPDVLAIYRIHGHNTFTNREGMGIDFLRACMYVLQAGLNRCDNFLEESIDHFRKAYLSSIKHEAIVSSRTHATD
jgi:glycosyltransferase involved in cell wall biosynthesis/predicted O-methyltransferase YrrM